MFVLLLFTATVRVHVKGEAFYIGVHEGEKAQWGR